MIVSDPVAATGLAAGIGTAPALAGGAGDAVVYVSLPPGTAPAGSRAIVRRVGDVATLTTTVLDGGFDPVPVGAQAGDSIEVLIANAGGGTVVVLGLAVAARRPPIVVRTNPPRRKTDVPINAAIVVVFSEPVAATSLTPSSVQLFRGTTAVAGTASLLQGSAAAAVFTPSAPLEANTDYRLVVTSSVRDLSGDALLVTNPLEFTTGTSLVGTVNNVTVLPDTTVLLVGSQLQFNAAARDSFGVTIPGHPLTWASDDSTVARVSATGVVTGRAQGVAHIFSASAQLEFYRGSATVIVASSLAPVDSVAVTPDTATVPLGPGGGAVRLRALTFDSLGTVLPFRTVVWSTSNPGVATVSGSTGGKAWVTAASAGTVTITATSEGRSASAQLAFVTAGPFATVAAGGNHPYGGSHTCGVTTDGWLLCWGGNQQGQLGTGVLNSPLPMGIGSRKFSTFSAQSAGVVCALTPQGAAYCWGNNENGNLGIGPAAGPEYCGVYLGDPCSREPTAVQGGLQFTSVGHGAGHGCGLTLVGTVYCWGVNVEGRLGTGSNAGPEQCGGPYVFVACSTVPVAVASAPPFSSLVVGGDYACGLTASGAAYCWGGNFYGQLGDGTRWAERMTPVPVATELSFVALSAGGSYGSRTCGLTADSTAYCWGNNYNGLLGTGDTASVRVTPGAVLGGLRFASISASPFHTCGVTGNGAAYCWGENPSGQLGDGTTVDRQAPTAVAGGLAFATVAAGASNTCGMTVAGIAYCWGDNRAGQLGTGSNTGPEQCFDFACSRSPVKVAGQP